MTKYLTRKNLIAAGVVLTVVVATVATLRSPEALSLADIEVPSPPASV